MATEQDWTGYADQGFIPTDATILVRTSAGAGAEVPGSAFPARRSAGGPVTCPADLVFGSSTFPSASASTGTAMGTTSDGSVTVQNAQTSNALRYANKTGWVSGVTYYDVYAVNGVAVGSTSSNGTTTTYGTTSDRRIKLNIRPAEDAGALIDAIEIVSHGWTHAPGEVPFGVIAQDLHQVYPLAVVEGDDENLWQVDLTKLVPLLIKEVQSLRARFAEIEGVR